MKRFWTLLQPIADYKFQVWLTIIAHIFSAIFTVVSLPLIIPFFQILFESEPPEVPEPTGSYDLEGQVKYFFVNLVKNHDKQEALLIVCASIIVVFFFKNIFRYAASYFITPVRNNLVADIRSKLFQKYLTLPMSFFTEESKGNLITRMSSDVTEIEHSILNMLEGAFKAPFIIIGCLFFMIYISPSLTVFVFILMLFVVFVIGSISRTLRRESGHAQSSISRIVAQLEETLGGAKVLKAFQAESFQQDRFDRENTFYKSKLTSIIRRRDLSSPLSEFLGVSVVAVLLYYGSNLVFSGDLNPGTFFAFIFAFYSIIEPSKLLANAYYNIQKGMASIDRIQEIQEIANPLLLDQGNQQLAGIQEQIAFDQVSFKYPNQENEVLKNISLQFKANELTALVGLSGAGKTTIVDLIPRYYDAYSGNIRFDGTTIKDLSIQSLRSNIGIVTQEPVLFNESILENIRFGLEEVDLAEVQEAAKLAHAHEFILSTEKGYETIVGDRGVKLSGGQRQRITLARAILKNPPILILDEATSALDAESETLVQAALDKFIQNRTTIVIAHRLSTIKKADKIYVLREGLLVEEGTHSSLIELDGEYSKFVQLQELN